MTIDENALKGVLLQFFQVQSDIMTSLTIIRADLEVVKLAVAVLDPKPEPFERLEKAIAMSRQLLAKQLDDIRSEFELRQAAVSTIIQ